MSFQNVAINDDGDAAGSAVDIELEEGEIASDADRKSPNTSDNGVPAYDKTKSFFDNISCEAMERSKGRPNRPDWKAEKQLNKETFGATGFNRRNYNQVKETISEMSTTLHLEIQLATLVLARIVMFGKFVLQGYRGRGNYYGYRNYNQGGYNNQRGGGWNNHRGGYHNRDGYTNGSGGGNPRFQRGRGRGGRGRGGWNQGVSDYSIIRHYDLLRQL